ncbi:MAG: zinc ABC transporter substrate-binding protein [Rikenellaceae bacterium]|jgi:zinc transport system substrate-binding protein|nr:zinc ABC transporter substrate-binding protein [Rikenellaceae bacterium]
MKNLKKIAISAVVLLVCAVCVACGGGARTKQAEGGIVVIIEPLRYIVEGIMGVDAEIEGTEGAGDQTERTAGLGVQTERTVGSGTQIEVLVPAGASPETYEPTPAQIAAVERAQLVFGTGLLDFERSLLGEMAEKQSFVNLSTGIELIEGELSHSDDEHHAHHSTGEHTHHEHRHGIDPHIWMSPKSLIIMADTAYERIHELYPDSLAYTARYERLRDSLVALDAAVEAKIAGSAHKSFLIFHPGLTYLSRDYGLRQIALEQDGKEPSARQLAEVIDLARTEKISKILYQSEFPRSMVEVVAGEIGAEPVEIDILGADVPRNILTVTDLIVAE